MKTKDEFGDDRLSLEALGSSLTVTTGLLIAVAVAAGWIGQDMADQALSGIAGTINRLLGSVESAWPVLVCLGGLWHRFRSQREKADRRQALR